VPKRIGYLWEKLISWQNLYLAYQKACKHKKRKEETAEWIYYCEKNIFELQSELQNGTYKPHPYRYFNIKEPKERLISIADFRDRVVHHALVNVIEPYFENIFIPDSYATRKGKGLHLAVSAVQNYSRKYSWFMKLDIEKFFPNIDHNILLDLINRKIKDPFIINLCSIILKNQNTSMNNNIEIGLPVGNLTSQFFANIYLNKLDQYIKHNLGYKGYVRYMDDIILFSNKKENLQRDLVLIRCFLSNALHLKIKDKVTQLNKVSQGIPFLGYRIFPNLIRISQVNLKRCLKNIQKNEEAYIIGKINLDTLYNSTRSRYGFISYANTNSLKKSIWGEVQ
jgi:retron-type reverse transcriptase